MCAARRARPYPEESEIIMSANKITARKKRKFRIRKKISGTGQRPRLNVFKSNRNFILQVIDDVTGRTLVSAHSEEKDLKGKIKKNNMKGAKEIGLVLAERAKSKGITQMVFDRNGYPYHGRIKQIAESLRENGIRI